MTLRDYVTALAEKNEDKASEIYARLSEGGDDELIEIMHFAQDTFALCEETKIILEKVLQYEKKRKQALADMQYWSHYWYCKKCEQVVSKIIYVRMGYDYHEGMEIVDECIPCREYRISLQG
jgi:hypothetical protein